MIIWKWRSYINFWIVLFSEVIINKRKCRQSGFRIFLANRNCATFQLRILFTMFYSIACKIKQTNSRFRQDYVEWISFLWGFTITFVRYIIVLFRAGFFFNPFLSFQWVSSTLIIRVHHDIFFDRLNLNRVNICRVVKVKRHGRIISKHNPYHKLCYLCKKNKINGSIYLSLLNPSINLPHNPSTPICFLRNTI